MKIRLGTLRRLVREAKAGDKTQHLVTHVVDVAEQYVSSVVAGSPDNDAAKQLRDSADVVAA